MSHAGLFSGVNRMDVSLASNGSGASAVSRWACQASHISPRWAAVVSAPESARAVELTPTEEPNPPCRTQPSHRKCVTSFSRASKRRLTWLIAQLSESVLSKALFLTLTYPASDMGNITPKRDIDVFGKRLARLFPSTSSIWKIEYTKRGVPHFHILLLGLDRWDHRELASVWASVVRSPNPNHQRAGTRIERVNSSKHAGRYISKYIAKIGAMPESHTGRCWGKLGDVLQFLSPKQYFALSYEQMLAARRVLDLLRKSLNRKAFFRRPQTLAGRKRCLCSGASVIRYLHWLGADPLSLSPT